MMALPLDEEIAEAECAHAGEFLFMLSANPDDEEAFKRNGTKEDYNATLSQPIHKKVTHLLHWLFFRVRGGAESPLDLVLSKKEAEAFKRGFVRMGSPVRRRGDSDEGSASYDSS